jgi:hypothetical protein
MSEGITKTPVKGHPDWNDYVLTQLKQEELMDGNPTTDGLRRLVELLLGPIVESDSDVYQCPNKDNSYTAVVKHTIEVKFRSDDSSRRFSGVADVNHRNTDAPFSAFAVATADTRAEGRALKRALGIKKVTAEETAQTVIDDPTVEEDTRIKDVQIKSLATVCKRLNVNVQKYVNSGSREYNSIKNVQYKTALEMIKKLNQYQQNMNAIPDDVKGFDPDWVVNFGDSE